MAELRSASANARLHGSLCSLEPNVSVLVVSRDKAI